jgi:hypothetical protein
MEGLLREKCIERGLSLPYLGGDVKMRAFLVTKLNLRAILNFISGPPVFNFTPRGAFGSQGGNVFPWGMFTPSFTPGPRGEHYLLFRRMEGLTRISPQGITSPTSPGDKIHPWGTISPRGSKFVLRVKVKNGPLSALTTPPPPSIWKYIVLWLLSITRTGTKIVRLKLGLALPVREESFVLRTGLLKPDMFWSVVRCVVCLTCYRGLDFV